MSLHAFLLTCVCGIGCWFTGNWHLCLALTPAYSNDLASLALLKPGITRRESSCDPEWTDTNNDARSIGPGETLVIADLEGPGVINHIWNTFTPAELGSPCLLVIRMYWDGEESPSVQSPLGDFFGVGHGLDRPLDSVPVSVSSHGRARNCYWPMPFEQSARITITNEGQSQVMAFFWYVDWQRLPALPPETAYFHAEYRQVTSATDPANVVVAEITGTGQYVGTVYSVQEASPGWWGEGDDFFFIDGETTPSLRGTGTEDYFCDAWGLRQLNRPYYGVPVFEGMVRQARTTAYRWHIRDPITFTRSLRFEIEHKGAVISNDGQVVSHFAPRPDRISSVAFWYQTEPHQPFGDMARPYERVAHDPDHVTEFEDLVPTFQTSGPSHHELQYGPWSGTTQVLWIPTGASATLKIPFVVEEPGRYDLRLHLTKGSDYGRYALKSTGNATEVVFDFYAETFHTDEFRMGVVNLESGTNELTFRPAAPNPDSIGQLLGLDCFLLEPVERHNSP